MSVQIGHRMVRRPQKVWSLCDFQEDGFCSGVIPSGVPDLFLKASLCRTGTRTTLLHVPARLEGLPTSLSPLTTTQSRTEQEAQPSRREGKGNGKGKRSIYAVTFQGGVQLTSAVSLRCPAPSPISECSHEGTVDEVLGRRVGGDLASSSWT